MPVESNPLKSGALAGLRVLDFTSRMGGYCGLLLANLGAEVILIEPPGGEIMRGEGPFKDSPNPEGSISFAAYHTNKQGIVLDLESENDRARLRHLVGHADVFIEDRPVAFWQRLGLGYEDLQVINPALVMTSISGFGSTGPYRDFKAPNIVAFAMGGLMNLCGHPERAPLSGPCDIAYRLGFVHAAFGTLVALFERRRVSGAAIISTSHCRTCWLPIRFYDIITRYSVTGEVLQRTGHSQATTVAETYQCRDGFVRIFCNQPDHWRRLVEWLGNPPELIDPKFENVQNRLPLRPLLDRLIEARTLNYDVKQFLR